jgi:hypothetical protein
MEVPADGRTLTLDFEPGAADVAGHALSALALLLLGLLGFAPGRSATIVARVPRPEAVAGAALAVVLIAGTAVKLAARPDPPRWRARDHVASARAWLGDEPCERIGGRHLCSERGWNYVGVTGGRIGGVMRRCVWAHPRAHAPLRVAFSGLPKGNELVVRHGLLDTAVDQARDGAPVRIDLAASGRALGSGTQPNRKGWFSFRVPAPDAPGEVAVTLQAPREGARHFCFDLEVR